MEGICYCGRVPPRYVGTPFFCLSCFPSFPSCRSSSYLLHSPSFCFPSFHSFCRCFSSSCFPLFFPPTLSSPSLSLLLTFPSPPFSPFLPLYQPLHYYTFSQLDFPSLTHMNLSISLLPFHLLIFNLFFLLCIRPTLLCSLSFPYLPSYFPPFFRFWYFIFLCFSLLFKPIILLIHSYPSDQSI